MRGVNKTIIIYILYKKENIKYNQYIPIKYIKIVFTTKIYNKNRIKKQKINIKLKKWIYDIAWKSINNKKSWMYT